MNCELKQINFLLISFIILSNIFLAQSQSIWTWVAGSNETNQEGNYGNIGEPQTSNYPSSRAFSTHWIDKDFVLWIFGGETNEGQLNDLWRYDGMNWTWISGSNDTNAIGNYGTIGILSNESNPSPRSHGSSWTTSSGVLWMFGGFNRTNEAYFSDTWKFENNTWTWIKGTSNTNQFGIYGSLKIPASENNPGGRRLSASWKTSDDVMWIFGGFGFDFSSLGILSDLWSFDGTNWTWNAGPQIVNSIGTYGTLNIASSDNYPGARWNTLGTWIDANDNLYLFGGIGFSSSSEIGYLDDMWKFDGMNWTWIGGSRSINRSPSYGIKGVPATGNSPGGRAGFAAFTDANGFLWIFGGSCFNSTELYSDLWRWDGSFWIWASGPSVANEQGSYMKEVPSTDRFPNPRSGIIHWVNQTGNFWIFGGEGRSSGDWVYFDDVWSITPILDSLTTSPLTTSYLTTSQEFSTSDSVTTSDDLFTNNTDSNTSLTTLEVTSNGITTDLEITTNEDFTSLEMSTGDPTTSELTTSELTTSELATSELTTSELTTSELTTSELNISEPTTSELTTSELTTSELTTSELTTSELNISELTTSEFTTSELTTSELTTSELTTLELTTSELTTSELNTLELTSSELTTSELTTSELNISELTTSELTTSELTTSEFNISELTTSKLTTSELTTLELTTSELTTSELTTSEFTTSELTTSKLTTSELTSNEITSSQLTTNSYTSNYLSTNAVSQITTESVDQNFEESKKKLKPFEIGIILGVVAIILLLLIGLFAFYIIRRMNSQNQSVEMDEMISPEETFTPLENSPKPVKKPNYISYGELEISKRVSIGFFGDIYQATWRKSLVAVTQLKEGFITESLIPEFEAEVKFIKTVLPHPNVSLFFGVCESPFCIITEFAEKGVLSDILANESELMDSDLQFKIIRGIASAVFHLHQEKIVHKNISAQSVWITSSNDVKLSNFGISCSPEFQAIYEQSEIGPLRWMAPETIKKSQFTKKGDVYSFGITILEILIRDLPFRRMDNFEFKQELLEGNIVPSLELPLQFSNQIRNLVEQCTHKDPLQRPVFEQIIEILDSGYFQL